jgi:hypothetical protein
VEVRLRPENQAYQGREIRAAADSQQAVAVVAAVLEPLVNQERRRPTAMADLVYQTPSPGRRRSTAAAAVPVVLLSPRAALEAAALAGTPVTALLARRTLAAAAAADLIQAEHHRAARAALASSSYQSHHKFRRSTWSIRSPH